MTEWIRFADESISPQSFSAESLSAMEELWRKALIQIGYDNLPKEAFFRLNMGTAELNLEQMLAVLRADGVFSLLKMQWKIEKYLSGFQTDADPDLQVRSLGLGICQQALRMRLRSPSEEELARCLIKPQLAPRSARRTINQLLKIQKQRDAISNCWKNFVKTESHAHSTDEVEVIANEASHTVWSGLPVVPGFTRGKFWIAPNNEMGKVPEDASILIFRKARPETVSYFPAASGIIFIEGGLLSHACSVAREMKIPCMTQVDPNFLSALLKIKTAELILNVSLNSGASSVRINGS